MGFCFLFCAFGVYWTGRAEMKIINNELKSYNNQEKEIVFYGTVLAEPDIREESQKLTLSDIVILAEAGPLPVEGRVLLTAGRYPEYGYGDKLKIKGVLEDPFIFDDFNYKDYLAKDGIYSVIYYPEINSLGPDKGGPTAFICARVLEAKDKLRQAVNEHFSPPHSSILSALILGDKRQIPPEWKDKLNYSGLRHLTAVSGMHVAILTSVLMSFFMQIGLWRKQSFFLTLALIFLFIILTGFQVSAVRAGIMGSFFLLARFFGRESQSGRAVILVAALMLFFNPLLLRLDVGFQLSFLAVTGIIYLMPLFKYKNAIVMTLCAQAFTLPVLIYNFGYFSLVSPISNVLVVPFLPLIMILGFVFAITASVFQQLALVFFLPLWLFLAYLIKAIDYFSSLPFSAVFLNPPLIVLIVPYLILLAAIWRYQKKVRLKILEY